MIGHVDETSAISKNCEAFAGRSGILPRSRTVSSDDDERSANASSCTMLTSGVETYKKQTFLSMVRSVVAEKPNKTFATWYDCKGQPSDQKTFQQLWNEAGVIGHYIQHEWNVKQGERVVLCYSFGLDFVSSFLACLRVGVTAVLVYPPNPNELVKSLQKMTTVIDDCNPSLILTDSSIRMLKKIDQLSPLSKSRKLWPTNVAFKATDKLRVLRKIANVDAISAPGDIAFLQYTSGSTGNPKGVMVSFAALDANVTAIVSSMYKDFETHGGIPDEISGFSWLPQYHDMGLIYAVIAPFAAGWRAHMISPVDFIRNPVLWLDLMSRHGVTWSVAPDFAYRLVARKYSEALASGCAPSLNLSQLRYLQSAAEPLRQDTQQLFADTFAKYGLNNDWFGSGYGLAEHVVYVSHHHAATRSDLRPEDTAPYLAVGSRDTLHPSITAIVVDPITRKEVPDGVTGELWVSSPSVAAGYFGKPQLTEEVFKAKVATSIGDESVGTERNFLRTGDLVFFQNDHLFICGRLKDLIIVNGVNYYPQDIEAAVEAASPSCVRPGCVAAFSSNETSEDGSVEIVFEIRKGKEKEAERVIQDIIRTVRERVGLQPAYVTAITERSIPKTTSGKIQRRQSRSSSRDGLLKVVHRYTNQGAPMKTIEESMRDLMSSMADLSVDVIPNHHELSQRRFSEASCTSDASSVAELSSDLGAEHHALIQIEGKIIQAWATVFQKDQSSVTLNDDFFETGGDSILAYQLTESVTILLDKQVSPTLIWKHPVLSDYAKAVFTNPYDGIQDEPILAKLVRDATYLPLPPISLEDKSRNALRQVRRQERLGKLVRQNSRSMINKAQISAHVAIVKKCILLTGATGFLGAHILRDMLLSPVKFKVVVLARGKDKDNDIAKTRVVETLKTYGLITDSLRQAINKRCKFLCGDLASPNFGLDNAEYERLSRTISGVIHSAAEVNHLKSYEELKGSNVHGTLEVLRFAASSSQPKPVFYMSSVGVFKKTNKVVLEDDDAFDQVEHLHFGYVQSKWVAEQICRKAQLKGFPVCIMRVGLLSPSLSQKDPIWPKGNFTSGLLASLRELKVCVQDGVLGSLNLVPVDFAAAAVTHAVKVATLFPTPDLWTTFHLCHPAQNIPGHVVHAWMESYSKETVRMVTLDELKDLLDEKANTNATMESEVGLSHLAQMVKHYQLEGADAVYFDCTRLVKLLEDSDVTVPVFGGADILRYVHSASML